MELQEIWQYFKFINDLIAINKEKTSHTETAFLDLHLCTNEVQLQTSLYDKRNSHNFNIVRFPYKSSNILLKMFFATIRAEILRIC